MDHPSGESRRHDIGEIDAADKGTHMASVLNHEVVGFDIQRSAAAGMPGLLLERLLKCSEARAEQDAKIGDSRSLPGDAKDDAGGSDKLANHGSTGALDFYDSKAMALLQSLAMHGEGAKRLA